MNTKRHLDSSNLEVETYFQHHTQEGKILSSLLYKVDDFTPENFVFFYDQEEEQKLGMSHQVNIKQLPI